MQIVFVTLHYVAERHSGVPMNVAWSSKSVAILQAGNNTTFLDTFKKANKTLEVIQKDLEDYLGMKRLYFPRFFFLSNDELLQILAQSKNIHAVQPHISKCFDGIKTLEFGTEPGSLNIVALLSAEGERIALGSNLKARGGVEVWLANVEQEMQRSLARLARDGYKSFHTMERTKWILEQPAQLVLVISQIWWAVNVVSAFEKGGTAMNDFYNVCFTPLSIAININHNASSRL